MLKYPLAILMLVFMASATQAQSGTRGGVPTAATAPQGSGSRVQGSAPSSSNGLALPGTPSNESYAAPSSESYAAPSAGSGTRGGSMSTPYYSGQTQTYVPALPNHCGRVYSYYAPVQTYYAPRVYYRPYYGRRHRCFGY